MGIGLIRVTDSGLGSPAWVRLVNTQELLGFCEFVAINSFQKMVNTVIKSLASRNGGWERTVWIGVISGRDSP